MNENDKPQPTEEQVKAANEAEEKRWEGDFDPETLKVPYKREEEPKKVDDPKDKKTDEEEEPKEVETYDDPEPVLTAEDPGDYKPADYSFEVTLKDGKVHKISTPEEADKLADDPDNFETPKQLMEFITKSNKMQRNLDKDHDEWEKKKKEFDTQSATEQERQKTVSNLVNGIKYLVDKGYLPAVDPQYLEADWRDPEVAKQPGVKEQVDLINYMTKENKTREKAGVPLLSSALDAYNAWKLDDNRKQQEAEQRAAGEARKAAGARVAGVSASNQAPYVPKGIAVGRVMPSRAQSVWED